MTQTIHHVTSKRELPGTDAFTRCAGWLSVDDRRLFTTVYLPRGRQRDVGVVLCAPPFHEYVHSHRTYRHLAEKLAGEGFVVVRFDYSGLGCSSSDLFAPRLIETWIADIVAQAALLESVPGVSRVGYFGFRFGATLASLAAEKRDAPLVAVWNPILNGKTYARELQAVAKFSEVPPEPGQSFLECAGFAVTQETQEAIRGIKLSPLTSAKALLLVHEGGQASVDALAAGDVTFIASEGASGVLEEPHKTVVPHALLERIVGWFTAHSAAGPNLARAPEQLHGSWTSPSGTKETLVVSEAGLVGILTQPRRDFASHPGVIVANAGSVHLPGPNQVNVELTRFLGDNGVVSLRVDLSNLGESCVGNPEQENVTYPDRGVEEVLGAVDALSESLQGRPIVLTGVCSGAYHSFQAAIHARSGSRLVGSILINPLTFYWEKGASVLSPDEFKTVGQEQYYSQSIKDPKRWLKLLSGNVDIAQLAGFVRRTARRQAKRVGQKLLERVGLVEQPRLAKDAAHVLASRRYLRFIFSDTDPGYKLLLHQGGSATEAMIKSGRLPITMITRADHTFAPWKSRREMFEAALEHLVRTVEAPK